MIDTDYWNKVFRMASADPEKTDELVSKLGTIFLKFFAVGLLIGLAIGITLGVLAS
jgi:hypothetical protein